jgi:ABC-2 type transport system ATP-binding protein
LHERRDFAHGSVTGETMEDAIKVEGLTKLFGDVRAVDGLNFTVPFGKVTGFLGPNGAGKTTTLRVILGLARPNSGRVTILGRPYRDLDEPLHTVGALVETAQFHPLRSGRNHLRVVAAVAGIDDTRVDEMLATVDLTDAANRKVGGYSLGMRQRLGLAAALLGDPRILVLDEPANGLDPAGMRWLRKLLRDLADRGRAVFVSSHLLAEIAGLADDVVVIDKGRLVTHAPVPELTERAAEGVRVRTNRPERLRDVLADEGIDVSLISHDELLVAASPQIVGDLAAAAGIPIYGLDVEERSLEDVFFELTGKA